MAKIKKIIAREVLDSRGIPTIEGKLILDNEVHVFAWAVSGKSTGKFEGKELRDGDQNRYNGLGVLRAVQIINNVISPKIIGTDITKHIDIDHWLKSADGTDNYSKLGVNTTMVVSQLLFKAAARACKTRKVIYTNKLYNGLFKKDNKMVRIPSPIFNLINGGEHGSKNLNFQEFHVIFATTTPFRNSLELAGSVYDNIKQILKKRDALTSVSEEGGFTPTLYNNTEVFGVIKEGLLAKRLKLGVDVFTGIDCSASHYYIDGKYRIRESTNGYKLDKYIDFIADLSDKYNILILEDPIHEEDDVGWQKLNQKVGKQSYVVADDFVAGNIERLTNAVKEDAANAVVLKFNQVGTMYEILEMAKNIKQAGLKLVFSHRLGESTDSFIADIAVGLQADFVKFGSPSRGERVAKYNRLLEIEKIL
ncbi:MAG: phosphopyruvate hydratase [Candidatus Paceibacterota bacterium]